MRHASLYRVGGYALVLGGLAAMIGIWLHPPQPMSLAEASALPQAQWQLSHWLLALGTALTIGGFVALIRHFGASASEGWAAVGLGIAVLGAANIITVVAPEVGSFSMLVGREGDVAAQHAYEAINTHLMGLIPVAATLFWVGIGCFALALSRDAAFPRWLGLLGVAVAVVELASGFLVEENWNLARLLYSLGNIWIALFGAFAARVATAVPAAAPTAAAGVH
ncbi:MAG: hypothetical protein HY561_12735 [Gemmatimonadetes bacterium]|nr:hypothetical protein [Gemmatimonadota bacterium]